MRYPQHCSGGSGVLASSCVSLGTVPSTHKLNVAAIFAEHMLVWNVCLGGHSLVSRFMHETRWMRCFHHVSIHYRNTTFSVVLEGLIGSVLTSGVSP